MSDIETILPSELLGRLRCAATQSSLALAGPELLARVNTAIARRQLLTRISQAVEEPCDAGLVNADGSLLYPIRAGIITLLASEAIEIWELES